MAFNPNCFFVSNTKVQPFKRCTYCEKNVKDCFGFQFLIISTSIIILLAITFFITDLPALVLDLMIMITVLVTLLAYLASKETNEIVLNNALLVQINKELDEKVKMRTKELEYSNEELRKADQMKNEFIGVINHELKTPITAFISGLELINVHGIDCLNDSQKKMLEIMGNSSQEMIRLVNNLLDVSKIEAGKLALYPDHFPLISMIDELVQSLKPEADKKKVKFSVNINKAISTIFVDLERFKQVLFNLIDNAIKYSNENGVVEITARAPDSKVEIKVKDSGLGMTKDHMQQIFGKFAKRAPGYKGTGLGLYISKTLIEAQNGKIDVESEPGKGTTFTITIPKK